jgi:hypothetical protein
MMGRSPLENTNPIIIAVECRNEMRKDETTVYQEIIKYISKISTAKSGG